MKIFKLEIKSGFSVESSLGFSISSQKSTPSASKTEFYTKQEDALIRKKQIEDAVTAINLVPYLVSVDLQELEAK